MKFGSVAIIGGGESGVGAALLGKKKGINVFVSEYGLIDNGYKKELEAHNIPFEEGGHTIERIKDFDLVVKSPGVGDHTEVIKGLNYYDVPIISEIEFGFYYTTRKIIGVTGSNGKTTTTGLIFHLLKEAGLAVEVGGNIGKSFARLLATDSVADIYVLELSSFQLDGIREFRPDIAVLLNITPDHLDRYDYKFENYRRSKWRIAMNQSEKDLLVYNSELEVLESRSRKIAIEKEYYKDAQLLTKSGEVFDITSTNLRGRHNRFNALCAIEVALACGISKEKISNALFTFENVPHRLQVVADHNSITYINDSKATNVDAVYYALEAMDRPVIWIVGGVDKGNDYEPIRELVEEKVRKKVYLGKDNDKLIKFFGEGVECRSMLEAVKIASSLAEKGEVVLLSPACASFDLFENYEDRGEQFIKAVKEMR